MVKHIYEYNPQKIIQCDFQKLVSVNACNNPITVDIALGLIGAYILQNTASKKIEWEPMNVYINFLRKDCFKGKKKSIITNSSFSECVSFICEHLSPLSIELKKGTLISFGLKVILGIDDNGYISFNDKTFNAYASTETINGIPSENYILKSTLTDSEPIHEDTDSTTIPIVEPIVVEDTNNQERATPQKKVLQASSPHPQQQNDNTDNSPFVTLYNKLIADNQKNRKDAKFVWQWFLTQSEYTEIKTCFTNNKLPIPSNWDNRTTNLIALYIGDFYKREYENNVTPFAQLGNGTPNVDFRQYNAVCEKLNLEPYKKDNQAHLHTLLVNGGLPVHYISSKLDNAKSNLFIYGLSRLLDAEDDIDISEGEDALGKVTNTALRESYQKGKGHSIFEYIQAIRAGNQMWDDSDNDCQEFNNFIDKISEASKKAAERKKFKLFYSMWTYLQESSLVEFSLQPQIRFNPEEDGDRHYAISLQRLANWGITDPPALFSLRLGDKEMKFTKCCNGDFISWDLADRIDLNGFDRNLTPGDLLHPDLTIVFDSLNGESTQIRNGFNLPFKNGFLQFYTDDDPSMASWNSFKGARSFLWSGLMYDKRRYHLISPITATNINEELGWVTFTDCVALEDGNRKIHTFYNSQGRIYAKPSGASLHRIIIDNPYLLPSCLLDGMAECTIGEERSYAYIVKSSNLKFDVFRVADDEQVEMGQLVEYKSAQDYLDPSSPWNEYQSETLEKGLYVFRVYKARYSTKVTCLVLPDNARIEFYGKSEPYWIKFIDIANVSSEGVQPSKKDNSIAFRISNNADSFNFTIGDDNGSIALQTYHPKPQTHVYLYYEEIDIKKQPVLIAYADDIEVKYISADKCGAKRLFEFNGLYKRLFDTLTATVTGDTNQILTQRININIENQDKLEVRGYTQEINGGTQEAENNAIKLMLLDLGDNIGDNSIREITGTDIVDQAQQIVNETRHDGLLFQSLRDIDYVNVYYAPKFISKDGKKLAKNAKTEDRRKRLTKYVKESGFVTDYAYKQFAQACEHRIFFAVFDSLLSMCWNVRENGFLDRNRKPFKTNIFNFLNGYVKYTTDRFAEPSVAGLKRLAREFLFDWGIIKNDVENSGSQQLKKLYQELINN